MSIIADIHMQDSESKVARQKSVSKSQSFYGNKLGDGTYGTVHRMNHDTVQKTISIISHDNCDVETTTVREICCLSTYKHPHIRGSNSIDIVYPKIAINMPDGGVPLDEWVDDTLLGERLPHIPKIVAQICSVLAYLEHMGCSHGDLKPQNILINSTHDIKVIDWGSFCFLPHRQKVNGCTEQFAAPELLEKPAHNGSPADIFSLGMTIRFLIYESVETMRYIKWKCYQEKKVPILEYQHLTDSRKEFTLIRKCQSFLQADPKLRPTADEVCSWSELEPYKLKDAPVYTAPAAQLDKVVWSADGPFNNERREKLIRRLFYIASKFGCYESVMPAAQLLEEYLISQATNPNIEKKLELYVAVCLMIACCLISTCLYLKDVLTMIDPNPTPIEFYNGIIDVIEHFGGKVYRVSFTDSMQHISYKHLQSLLLRPDVMSMNHSQRLESYLALIKADVKDIM